MNLMPQSWIGRAHLEEVRSEFSSLFQYTIILWLMEFISIFTTPLVLIFTLPPCADDIVNYIREGSKTVKYGNCRYLVCRYSMLNLETDGDESYGSPVSQLESEVRDREFMPKHGKIEMSFIGFQNNYPNWTPKTRGQNEFLQSISQYSQEHLHEGSQYTFSDPLRFHFEGTKDVDIPIESFIRSMHV